VPIRLPNQFPARDRLALEGIDALSFERAAAQDIRPLKVVLFNLMPTKIDTEVQLLRLLSRSSIQIEASFLRAATHEAKHGADHLDRFYVDFDDIKDDKFDAIIITGAPVEQLPFDEVDYWSEFEKVVHWANNNVFAELFICWGAAAGLQVDFGVGKEVLDEKLFGVYPHKLAPESSAVVTSHGGETTSANHPLMRGFDDVFNIPNSRFIKPDAADLERVLGEGKLIPLAVSDEIGVNILTTPHIHKTYVLGHFEYDRETLDAEYRRDTVSENDPNENKAFIEVGPLCSPKIPKSQPGVKLPVNYYPSDDPTQQPNFSWRSHANLFFMNWIDYIYQETPYDLADLKPCRF
jgi:homoserine O-succinyltransferase